MIIDRLQDEYTINTSRFFLKNIKNLETNLFKFICTLFVSNYGTIDILFWSYTKKLMFQRSMLLERQI